MQKRAIILHGTDGNPAEIPWQTWLQEQLENCGYEVFFPQLPGSHEPNLEVYDKYLQDSGWDFSNNLIIGHSSGATTALHLLQQEWFPNVKATVLVGVFLNEKLMENADWYEPGQFDKLFIESFEPKRLKKKSKTFYFVHGDDDPYCDYEIAKQLCADVQGEFLTIYGGHHIAKTSGIRTLPILTDALSRDGLM